MMMIVSLCGQDCLLLMRWLWLLRIGVVLVHSVGHKRLGLMVVAGIGGRCLILSFCVRRYITVAMAVIAIGLMIGNGMLVHASRYQLCIPG